MSDLKKWLIFTDLDGTLLDHHDYNFVDALPALEQLQKLGIAVIINSSKTLAEIAQISQKLNLNTPQIAENGSIIYYPDTQKTQYLGADYRHICNVLDTLRRDHSYDFIGFHDWTPEDIVINTGLTLEAAKQAAKRQGTEPILWQSDISHINKFKQHLQDYELELKQGGRFWHVMGKTDKAIAMKQIQKAMKANKGIEPYVIALGDSENDRDMLSAANVAIKVKNPKGSNFTIDSTKTPTPHRLIETQQQGSAGWNEAITQLLNEHSLSES